MHISDIESLDKGRTYWVPAVVSPGRNWTAAPGSHKGSRFLIDRQTQRPTRDEFEPFETELSCLHWIMRNRASLNRRLAGAPVRAVQLDRWLLGLD